MKPTPEITALVNKTPDLDKHGKVHGAAWEDAILIYDGILKHGRDGVRQVIGMLVEIDDGTDYKARYTLHGLSMYVGRPGKASAGKVLREALESELGGDVPKNAKGYLLRQLQLVGSKESAAVLGGHLLDEENSEYAAQALLAINDGAVEQFRAALPKAKGKQRATVVQALGVLEDSQSASAIRKLLGDPGESLRITAAWTLARCNDASSAPALLALADKSAGWERTQVTNAALILAEKNPAAGTKIYEHLKKTRTDPSEKYLNELAEEALTRA